MAQILPSKKQHALLEFIDGFIRENEYAPSYREVMRALDYKSVSTVAKHINGLIERGWLVKRDNSKRSLEVTYEVGPKTGGSPALAAPARSASTPRRLSEEELTAQLTDAREKVEVGGTYTHYKGGAYKVIDVAIQTDSGDETCVVYQAEYGQKLLFTRPLSDWLALVDADGQRIERFKRTE